MRVSKNYVKGEPIKDATRIMELARERKAVYHKNWRMRPAAFILGMQFMMVMNAIKNGHLYEIKRIEPKDKIHDE